MFKFI